MTVDEILGNTGIRIVSEQHDVGKINADISDGNIDSIIRGRSGGGGWDAAEMGISLAEAERMFKAANTTEARAAVIADIRQRAQRRAGLDTSNGRVSVMVAGKAPWHGLGVVVNQATTSAEAIRLAGLDWQVVKTVLSYEFGGQRIDAKDVFGIVRQDTGKMLGSVGSRYQPIQNGDGFDFLDAVLGAVGARYETAGSLYGGRTVWMLAHLPQQRFSVNGGDAVEPYVIFTNPHDGSGMAYCYPTTERVVCANTFRISTSDRSKGIGIRHTGNVKDKIAIAQSALGMAVDGFEEFRGAAEALYSKRLESAPGYFAAVLDAVLDVTAADAVKGPEALASAILGKTAGQDKFEAKVTEFKRAIERRTDWYEDIMARHESERCGAFGTLRGTAWSAFQAVTESADHNTLTRRVGSEEEKMSRRFESVIAGDADAMKQAAFSLAMAV